MARKTEHSRKIGARDPANLPHRHPVLREVDRLPGFHESIRLLIAKQAGLDLNVSTVVVGEGVAPVHAFFVHAPGPDLLGG